MQAGNSTEKHTEIQTSVERPHLTVTQPEKIANLLDTLNLIDNISERMGEDRSGDLGAAGTGATGKAGAGAQAQISPRDKAIASLPSLATMQQQLTKEIEKEVKQLRGRMRRIPVKEPGAAYKMNKLYARIRRLRGLLAELVDASLEVIKRLFIRVFIDKQQVLQ